MYNLRTLGRAIFMWSREIFKSRAKKILSKSYWIAFLVCLLGGIITGGSNILNFNYHGANNFSSGFYGGDSFYLNGIPHHLSELFSNPAIIFAVLLVSAAVIFTAALLGLAYSFFVAYPIKVGMLKFFLENRKGNTEFVKLFSSFKKGRYLETVKGMAWKFLFQFLWTLLFIIPGIIKAYSYFMVPYILADNPNIGFRRALKLSIDMTYGYKWKIFVLQLSFLGWWILGAICCGVGVLFVNPYYQATIAEMYGTVRKNAVEKGICRPEELNLSESDYQFDIEGFNN